jgi:hypothetical protein
MAEAKDVKKAAAKGGARSTQKTASPRKAPMPVKPDDAGDANLFSETVAPPQPVLADAAALPSSVQERGETLRQAVSEAVSVSAQGILEVNDKIIEAFQAQSSAALDLWQTTISAPHLSEAIRIQTSGTRQVYETASAQWKDIAEASARWFTRSLEPLQSAMHRQTP